MLPYPSRGEAGAHPRTDELALKLRDAGEDAEHDPAVRSGSVNALVKASLDADREEAKNPTVMTVRKWKGIAIFSVLLGVGCFFMGLPLYSYYVEYAEYRPAGIQTDLMQGLAVLLLGIVVLSFISLLVSVLGIFFTPPSR